MERDTGSVVRRTILFLILVLFTVFALNEAILSVRADEEIQEGSDEKASSDLDPRADSTSLDQIPLEPPKMEIKLRLPEEREFRRVVSNRAFGVGERLEFSVGYGVIKAGTAVMEGSKLPVPV